MKNYTYLLFDLDHTLLDFDLAEDIALTALLTEVGVSYVQVYKDYYIPMNKAMWLAFERGEISKQELVNTRFAKLFAHFGQEVDGAQFQQRFQYFLSQQGQTYAGAEALLAALQVRGYELYGATNGVKAIQEGRLASSAISPYFKQVFISEETGSQKPDKAFYDFIASRIAGFDHSRTLMIGDSLTADIQGGINAGIDTVWYNPRGLENTTELRPTVEVRNYQELADVLGVVL